MTRTHLNVAIDNLLDRASKELDKMPYAGEQEWTARMAASIVFSGLADVLIEIRKIERRKDLSDAS